MGQKFWGVDIQKEIGLAMKQSDLPNYTLVKNPTNTRTTEAGGTNSRTITSPLTIHGSIVDFDISDLDSALQIQKEDVCLVVIGKTIDDAGTTIDKGDFVILDGRRRNVVNAKHDGARAAWRLQLR